MDSVSKHQCYEWLGGIIPTGFAIFYMDEVFGIPSLLQAFCNYITVSQPEMQRLDHQKVQAILRELRTRNDSPHPLQYPIAVWFNNLPNDCYRNGVNAFWDQTYSLMRPGMDDNELSKPVPVITAEDFWKHNNMQRYERDPLLFEGLEANKFLQRRWRGDGWIVRIKIGLFFSRQLITDQFRLSETR